MGNDADMSPRQRALRPAGQSDAVLRLLAAGMTVDAIANRLASDRGRKQAEARPDLKTILVHAAALVREKSLLAPAEAAFLEKRDIEVSASEFGALRSVSERILQECITEPSNWTPLPDPKRDVVRYAALRYAEALVRQEEVLEALGRVDSSSAPLQAGLTGTDRDRIDEFLLYRNVRGRFETLDSLVDLWERSVAWVEDKGESYAHDEYADRLMSRDSLEDALSLLSPAPRRTLESSPHALDERFLDATRAVSKSIRPRSPWEPQRWWWFRVPRLLGQQFQDRLEHVAPAVAREALAAQAGEGSQLQDETRS